MKIETITYSLKGNQKNSDNYYNRIKSFTDEVLNEFKSFETQVISDFMSYIEETNMNKISSYNEYIFEFLMLGVFWRVYSARAANLDKNPQKILENLVKERNQNEPAKETIDIIRGMIMKPFLLSENSDSPDLTVVNFKKLLAYLKAAGDFKQELKRLEIWKDFLNAKDPEIASQYLADAFLFADWFEYKSKFAIGQYTANVDKFLAEKHHEHLFQEDVIFCGRREVEYHLNMVGAEIMNRSFRKEFEKRQRKALILPGCMKYSARAKCRAQDTDLGLKCMGCSKNCNVNELTKMGDENHFEVYIVSHESSAFSKSTEEDRNELGIIGVACVPNLIAGGWKAVSLGIPAQCVLLDYSSCKNHWDEEGFPTSINLNQLMTLLCTDKSNHIEPLSYTI
ncbi:DUF116 domain-containing protein [Methanobacterium sp. MBAC-LM]|uniref:DUF116 domain-containing protein n=1 Tax=Methanobacterium sp. MBAC-LM TaxID=3412034 RepID=UPI003C73338A